MKCSYCGIEWRRIHEASGYNHDENGCPMSGVYTYPPVIQSVNKAIEATKMQRVTLGEIKVFPKALTKEEAEKL